MDRAEMTRSGSSKVRGGRVRNREGEGTETRGGERQAAESQVRRENGNTARLHGPAGEKGRQCVV